MSIIACGCGLSFCEHNQTARQNNVTPLTTGRYEFRPNYDERIRELEREVERLRRELSER